MNEKPIEHDITIRLTKAGKLPFYIPCTCFGGMRRVRYRRGAVYSCPSCGNETTLDPGDLKRLNLK